VSGILRPGLALSKRSVISIVRQPQLVIPSMFFPLMIATVNTASMGRAVNLPGFPKVDSFLDFALATTIVQGVLFGAVGSGSDMAIDIEGGFFDRLAASPAARGSILVGRLAGAAALAVLQSLVFVAIFMGFGATIKGGPAALLALLLVAVLLALGIGGVAVTLALRTGSAEAVQAGFPAFFVSLFLSSAFFPKELMTGVYGTIARWNPMSPMIEAMRRLVTVGFDIGDVAMAMLVPSALAVVSILAASAALRHRVAAA
jgi:ABC-2 type transport system permease protein